MKKMYKIIAFVLLITITALTLTSGISKDKIRDGGDRDLVEELYREAIKQNDNLEAIEDNIEKFYKSKTEALENTTALWHITIDTTVMQDQKLLLSAMLLPNKKPMI